jgi:hypothetical protein
MRGSPFELPPQEVVSLDGRLGLVPVPTVPTRQGPEDMGVDLAPIWQVQLVDDVAPEIVLCSRWPTELSGIVRALIGSGTAQT